jgi:hypothetical protein
MKHVVAAIDRIAPAGILRQVGGEERKRLSRRRSALTQHREHIPAPVRMTHSGAHVVAGGQQLQDGMHPDKTRPACNQNRAHCKNPSSSSGRGNRHRAAALHKGASGHYLDVSK